MELIFFRSLDRFGHESYLDQSDVAAEVMALLYNGFDLSFELDTDVLLIILVYEVWIKHDRVQRASPARCSSRAADESFSDLIINSTEVLRNI